MARYITVLSEANYVLGYDATPGMRKSMKRASSKARRALGKVYIKEAALIDYEDWYERSLDAEIDWYIDGGAIPGCGCGCGGMYLADLIETRERGLYSVAELRELQERERKQHEIDLMWSEYSTAS